MLGRLYMKTDAILVFIRRHNHPRANSLTINVPDVYMAQDVMILMRATSITRAIGWGCALKIDTYLGPEMATSFEKLLDVVLIIQYL